jgi:pyruvate/2-oxoglutarate dehydrogenase complex dihydrolipoamide dehydrogenase (E3) component
LKEVDEYEKFDVAVVGAGPGGSYAAKTASRLPGMICSCRDIGINKTE